MTLRVFAKKGLSLSEFKKSAKAFYPNQSKIYYNLNNEAVAKYNPKTKRVKILKKRGKR